VADTYLHVLSKVADIAMGDLIVKEGFMGVSGEPPLQPPRLLRCPVCLSICLSIHPLCHSSGPSLRFHPIWNFCPLQHLELACVI
jgi:hypothetical protein